MLYEHPGVARHVQKLVVRQGSCSQPKNFTSSTLRGFSYAVPSHVCAAVKRAAAKLDALQSFIWGGEDYPSEDDIWFVLRQSYVPFPLVPFTRAERGAPHPPAPHRCPQLKSIGVGFGALLPSVRSHVRLFLLVGLRSFRPRSTSLGFHSYSTLRTSKASRYGSNPRFTPTVFLI
jgi:hypothetical protein